MQPTYKADAFPTLYIPGDVLQDLLVLERYRDLHGSKEAKPLDSQMWAAYAVCSVIASGESLNRTFSSLMPELTEDALLAGPAACALSLLLPLAFFAPCR